jgi:hypothetical protein
MVSPRWIAKNVPTHLIDSRISGRPSIAFNITVTPIPSLFRLSLLTQNTCEMRYNICRLFVLYLSKNNYFCRHKFIVLKVVKYHK